MSTPLNEYLAGVSATKTAEAIERKVVERMEDPGISRTDNSITVTMRPDQELGDLRALIEKRGLDPDEWTVQNVIVNEWESGALVNGEWTTVTLHQLKVSLKPTLNFVKPARIDGPKWNPIVQVVDYGRSKQVVQLPDQQAPYHDQRLHDLVCKWLMVNQPDEVVLSGDLFDFPSISRHRKNRKMHTTAQRSIDTGYQIVKDYQSASPITRKWVLVPGNHEVRLENFLLDRDAEEIADLRRAGDPDGKPLLSLAHVARLDELGVEVADSPFSTYPHPHYKLTENFDIWHGWMVRPDSGASALATIRKTGRSASVGHTHRAGIVSLNDMGRQLYGVEAGTLAQVEGGLGYEVAPNWENAFAVFRVFPSGLVHPSLAYYRDGALIYGNQIFTNPKVG